MKRFLILDASGVQLWRLPVPGGPEVKDKRAATRVAGKTLPKLTVFKVKESK